MKVLLINDDERVRDALEIGIQLQGQDAQVLTAADGETGLDRFLDEERDIVLLVVTTPRKNGFEVLKAIRQVSEVPVLMLTAATMTSTRSADSNWPPTTTLANRSATSH
jgi:DNA-binding response OmpR family regulator